MRTATVRTSAHVLSDMRGWGGGRLAHPLRYSHPVVQAPLQPTPLLSPIHSLLCAGVLGLGPSSNPKGTQAATAWVLYLLGIPFVPGPTPPSASGVVWPLVRDRVLLLTAILSWSG